MQRTEVEVDFTVALTTRLRTTWPETGVFKFADDAKIFRQVRDMQNNIRMQADLDKLVERTEKWQIQFNVSKFKVMHVNLRIIELFLFSMGNNGLQTIETVRRRI